MTLKLCILVVDDHADTLSLVTRILRRQGHVVLAAAGFSEAVQFAGLHPIDLLVTDIRLPDGTGWELLEVMRKRHPHLVGIAVTGLAFPVDIRKSEAAGFCVHLKKPFDVDGLLNAIESCTSILLRKT